MTENGFYVIYAQLGRLARGGTEEPRWQTGWSGD
jgi:hypothetical protein